MNEEWQNYIDIENIDYVNDPYFHNEDDEYDKYDKYDKYDEYEMSEKRMRILSHIFGLISLTICYLIITIN